MTTDFEVERRVGGWLEEGPLAPADWAIDDAIQRAVATPRRRHILHGSQTMRWIWTLGVAAAAAVVIGVAVIRLAPSGSVGGLGGPPPSVSASASAVIGPRGTWSALVGTNSTGTATGAWQLTFMDTQLFLRNPNGESFAQDVTYGASELTLGADDCPSGTGSGVYTWTESGATLTLTLVADPSPCRVTVFGALPWTKVAQP